MPWATARSPSWRWWSAAMAASRPMSCELVDGPGGEPVAARLVAGERLALDARTTSWPALASQKPAAAPAGPPPMTRTSWRSAVVMERRVGDRLRPTVSRPGPLRSHRPARTARRARPRPGSSRRARRRRGRLVVGVLLGDVLVAAERALVQHDLGDLLVGERAASRASCRCRRWACSGRRRWPPGQSSRAEADPGGVVAPVGPGRDDRAVAKLGTGAAAAGRRRGTTRSCRRRPRRRGRAGRPRRRAAARACGCTCSPTAAARRARTRPSRACASASWPPGCRPARAPGARAWPLRSRPPGAGARRGRRHRRVARRRGTGVVGGALGRVAAPAHGRTALPRALQKVLGYLCQRSLRGRLSGRSLYARHRGRDQACGGASGGAVRGRTPM